MSVLKRFNHNDLNQFMLDNQPKSLIERFKSKKMIRFVPAHFFLHNLSLNDIKADLPTYNGREINRINARTVL
jgi:hypothetical protein